MDLTLRRGDTRTLTIPLVDDVTALAYTPPAGATAIFTIKRRLTDADNAALVQKATGGLGITFSGTNALVSILNADTATLTDTLAYYDVQVQETGGRVLTAAFGKIALPKDATIGLNTAIPITTTDPATAWATGKTLWVDATNGSDTTGTRGFQNLPFASIPAAITAASSGDLVHVRPGTYTAQITLKNGVNLHFEEGAIVNSATRAITDNNAAVTCLITGRGAFTSVGRTLEILNAANTGICVEAQSLNSTGAGAACVFLSARIPVKVWGSIQSAEYDGIIIDTAGSGFMRIEADSVDGCVTGDNDGQAVEMNSAGTTLVLKARTISARWSDPAPAPLTDIIAGTLLLDVDHLPSGYEPLQSGIGDLYGRPIVVEAYHTAMLGQTYHVVASLELDDPTPPQEGKGYEALIVNGTLTLPSGAISGDGKFVRRVWHSGSWRTYVYSPS
jgi:hypothetical protein